jgi:hypothetical protein
MLDNRRSDRITLPQPIEARVGGVLALLIDLSQGGLQVHHSEPLPPRGERVTLHFTWNGTRIELATVIMWTAIHELPKTTSARPVLSSGLRIELSNGEPANAFGRMLAHFRDAREGAKPDPPAHYLFCELVNGAWKQMRTFRREQPAEGFTVSASEDMAQVERLCAAYAGGDSETRKLIRTLAALSIKKQNGTAAEA